MCNQTIIIGRLVNEPEKFLDEEGKKYVRFTVATSRNFKNMQGEYDTDFFKIRAFDYICDTAYLKKGDLIGVKARLESDGDNIHIIAEKITFLSSNRG